MGRGIDDGIFVDIGEDDVVAAIVELVDEGFESFAQLRGMMVLPFAEEDFYVVRDASQMHLSSAECAEVRELGESGGECRIVGIVQDDFFAVELSAGSESEQPHEEVPVAFDVEDDAVCVGFVREEDACAEEHGRAEPGAALDGPRAHLCVVFSCLVDDIIEDEYDDTDDDRHAEASFANDGAEGCSDEEEEEAGQTHREFLVPFDAVLAQIEVAVARLECAELAFGEHRLGTTLGVSPGSRPSLVAHGEVDGVERGLLCGLSDNVERVGTACRYVFSQVPCQHVGVYGVPRRVGLLAQGVYAV